MAKNKGGSSQGSSVKLVVGPAKTRPKDSSLSGVFGRTKKKMV